MNVFFTRFQIRVILRNPNLLQIERVQNPSLYLQYDIYKRSVKQHMITTQPVERELFHGTDAAGIESILRSGFDRNFAGKHGKLFSRICQDQEKEFFSLESVKKFESRTSQF